MTAAGVSPSDTDGGLVAKGIDFVKAILGPASLGTVVLYYFGWVRSNAIARYWGYSTDLIGLSNDDFLLSSVIPMFRPLAFAVLALLVGQRGLDAIRDHLNAARRPPPWLLGLGNACLGFGAALLFLVVFRLDGIESEIQKRIWYLTATMTIAGSVCIAAGLWLRTAWSFLKFGRVGRSGGQRLPARLIPLSTTVVLGAIVVLGVFIFTTQFASRVGVGRALALRAELPDLAVVTLYSEDRLYLSGRGVSEVELAEDSTYRWRYRGLRLLVQGDDQLILVPGSYADDNARAFVIPVGDGLRLDLDRTEFWRRVRVVDDGAASAGS